MAKTAMQAIILCAGKGTRLIPKTQNLPKCLIRIGEFPILYHQLAALEKNKISDIILVIGFKSSAIKKYVSQQFPNLKFTFVINNRFATTNTLYSLALCSKAVKSSSRVLQMNGDVMFDPKIITELLEINSKKSYACVQFKKCSDEEIKITLKKNGSIVLMNKKINPTLAVGEAVGINLFSFSFWRAFSKKLNEVKEKHALDYFEYALEQTIACGKKIYPFDIENMPAIDIDSASDLMIAAKVFSNLVPARS